MSIGRKNERGDTLVEVLVAITVLAIVVVGALSVMNRGVAQMYDDMERSEIRQLINAQVELLTYARDQYFRQTSMTAGDMSDTDKAAAQVWVSTKNPGYTLDGVPELIEGCSDTSRAFFIKSDDPVTYPLFSALSGSGVASGLPAPGDGLWIQKVDSAPTVSVAYSDFYIRACWYPTANQNLQVISTVVRLYDR